MSAMPNFLVFEEGEDQESGRKIKAHDAQDAAEEWARMEDSDSGEDSIARGSEETAIVVKLDDGKISKFTVFGEYVPEYYATEKK